MRKPYVYLITDLRNGKIYIGITNGKRDRYFGGGNKIKKYIREIGRDKFTKTILIEGDFDDKKLSELEIYYINLYNSTDPNIGYNISKGGVGYNGVHSDETKRKMSESRKGSNHWAFGKKGNLSHRHGISLTDEQKTKISIANKGKKRSSEQINSMRLRSTGKKQTKDEIEKKSSAMKCKWDHDKNYVSKVLCGLKRRENHPKSKKVYQFDATSGLLIKTWNYCKEAILFYNNQSIKHAARGACKTASGFKWSYSRPVQLLQAK